MSVPSQEWTPEDLELIESDLMPLGAVRTPDDGPRESYPAIFDSAPDGGRS